MALAVTSKSESAETLPMLPENVAVPLPAVTASERALPLELIDEPNVTLLSGRPAPVRSVFTATFAPRFTAPLNDALCAVVPALRLKVGAFRLIELPVTVRLVSGAVRPTLPAKLALPLPAVTFSAA